MVADAAPPAALDRAPAGAWSAPGAGDADLVFDLTGSAEPEPGAIVPLYDGAAGDAARDAALLDGRAPWIELAQMTATRRGSTLGRCRRCGDRDLLSSGRAAVADALAALVVQLAGRGLGEAAPLARTPRRRRRPLPVRFAAATLAGLIERRLRRLVVHDSHWRVGVRRARARRSAVRRPRPARRSRLALAFRRSPPLFRRSVLVRSRAASPMSSAKNIPTRPARASFRSSRSTTREIPARRASCWSGPTTSPIPSCFRHDGAIWMIAGERAKPHARTLPRRSVSVPLDARPRAVERDRDRRRDAVRLERRLVAERRRAAKLRARAGTACRSIAAPVRSARGLRPSTDRR